MGPHSVECGMSTDAARPVDLVRLQWGRTLSSAECHFLCRCNSTYCRSFNGAALCRVRNGRMRNEITRPVVAPFNGAALCRVRNVAFVHWPTGTIGLTLQWGRTLSSAECLRPVARHRVQVHPSMGPHSVECGMLETERESGGGEGAFNGAALCR